MAAADQFWAIQMVEVWLNSRAGGCICLERVTQPGVEADFRGLKSALIHPPNLALHAQAGRKRPRQPLFTSSAGQNVWTTRTLFSKRSGSLPTNTENLNANGC